MDSIYKKFIEERARKGIFRADSETKSQEFLKLQLKRRERTQIHFFPLNLSSEKVSSFQMMKIFYQDS